MAVAARDNRVAAVVGLDPVFHEGGVGGGEGAAVWDAAAEAPHIAVPTAILGAPADACNANTDYADLYPLVGAVHKAYFHVENASHCAFSIPGNSFCGIVCGGETDGDKARLSNKYMTGWLNYYLHYETENYAYLFGSELAADVSANLIDSAADTAPDGATATGHIGANMLSWQPYHHPIVVGYAIQRRLLPAGYRGDPLAQPGVVEMFNDTAVSPNKAYGYQIMSRDAAGNLHQASAELLATPVEATESWFLPLIRKNP